MSCTQVTWRARRVALAPSAKTRRQDESTLSPSQTGGAIGAAEVRDVSKWWTRGIEVVLLGTHAVLVVWALGGLVEWVTPEVPWGALTVTDLPRGLMLVHWLAMLGTGLAFIIAFARWRQHLLAVMAAAYLSLVAICAIETFFYLQNASRYANFAVECATYAGILGILWLRARAARPGEASGEPAPGSHGRA